MTGAIDNGDGPTYGEGQDQQGTTDGINQHWQEYLKDVPQEFHEKVIPAFKAWDSGVNDMVQRVHSQYEPWKHITKQYDPQTASWALNVYDALSNDPQTVYEALGEWMKQNNIQPQQQGSPSGQGQEPGVTTEDQNPYAQEMANLAQQNRLITDYLKAQQQAQLEAQWNQQLDNDLAAARQKYGLDEMGERFVLGLMAANENLAMDQAAQQYAQYRDQLAQNYRPKPLLMGSGGGAPGTGVDVRKLDDKGTKDLVVQMLMHNKAQQQ